MDTLYHQNYLRSNGANGEIAFRPERLGDIDRIVAKYTRQVATFTPLAKKVLLKLSEQGEIGGKALAKFLSPNPSNEIKQAVYELVEQDAVEYPYIGPFPLEETNVGIKTKGRVLAKLLPAAQPIDPSDPLESARKKIAAGADRFETLMEMSKHTKTLGEMAADSTKKFLALFGLTADAAELLFACSQTAPVERPVDYRAVAEFIGLDVSQVDAAYELLCTKYFARPLWVGHLAVTNAGFEIAPKSQTK